MKKMMWLFSILAFLFLGNVANADGEVDLLNLDSYSEGESVSYGKYVIVGQDEETGEKWLVQQPGASKKGNLTIPVNLSGDIEVYVRASSGFDFDLISNENKITLSYSGFERKITEFAGEDTLDVDVTYNPELESAKLVISGSTAKLYDKNGEFLIKITLSNPNLTYTRLEVRGFFGSYDKLYELTTKSSEGSAPLGEFDRGKQEGIQQCVDNPESCGITGLDNIPFEDSSKDDCMVNYSTDGTLKIPCVSVPDAFGGNVVYGVEMQQQPDSFTFDLDMGSVKPK